MVAAFDSYYTKEMQKTVCVVFPDWFSPKIEKVLTGFHNIEDAYHPGQFYRRELPGILQLIQQSDFTNINTIIVDAFVWLDDEGTPGLGARLYESIHSAIPVIGVAKANFGTAHQSNRLVYRGASKKPLYISAIGTDPDQAARNIQAMPGKFRIPDMLKTLDRLTRL